MKRRDFLRSVAATLLVAGCGSSREDFVFTGSPQPQPVVTLEQVQKLVDDAWAKFLVDRPDFRGAVVLHADSPNGSFDAAAGETPPDFTNVHFRCGSTTKTWTAAAIMLLDQQGRLRIDDTLDDTIPGTNETYLPQTADWAIPNRSSITLRSLLQHRSGVFDVTNQDIPETSPQPYAGQRWFDWHLAQDPNFTATAEQTARAISLDQLSNFPPDQEYRYSNTGYALLTEILQRITGMRHDQYLQQTFFVPLGLTNTRAPYLGSDQAVDAPYYTGWFTRNGVTSDRTLDNMSENVGEGNIITTMRDHAKWIRALFTGGTPLKEPALREMMAVRPTGDGDNAYGLGLAYTPGLGFGHAGAHVGYITVCFYDPVSDSNILVMINHLDNRAIAPTLCSSAPGPAPSRTTVHPHTAPQRSHGCPDR